jgi:hypothetical protein
VAAIAGPRAEADPAEVRRRGPRRPEETLV